MNKFKVGDKVFIKHMDSRIAYTKEKTIGKTSTIIHITDNTEYPYKLKDFPKCGWSDEELTLIEDTQPTINNFTELKQDIIKNIMNYVEQQLQRLN